MRALPLGLFFDLLGVRLNPEKADGKTIVINWEFADTGERYLTTLQNCALTYLEGRQSERADATVKLERSTLNRILARELALADALASGAVRIEGAAGKVAELFGLLDDFSPAFEVVEPLRRPGASP